MATRSHRQENVMRVVAIPIALTAAAASVLGTGVPAHADQPSRYTVEFTVPEVDVCTGQDVLIDFRFEYAEHTHEGAKVVTVRGFMTDSLGGSGRSAEVEVSGPSTTFHFANWIVRNPSNGTVHRMVVRSEFDPVTGAEIVTHQGICIRGAD
jgi:hypothetical protein